jgi:hypothetical protein
LAKLTTARTAEVTELKTTEEDEDEDEDEGRRTKVSFCAVRWGVRDVAGTRQVDF